MAPINKSDLGKDLARATSGGWENLWRGAAGVAGNVAGLPWDFGVSEAKAAGPQTSYTGPQSTQVQQSTQPQQSTQGVLGRSTQSGGGGGGGGGGGDGLGGFSMDLYPGWNYDNAIADYKATGGPNRGGGGGGGGDQGPSFQDQIDEMFGSGYSYLNRLKGDLETAQREDLAGITGKVDAWGNRIGEEATEMEAAIAEQQRQLGEVSRGAYADATRSYNNLVQQGLSRFGAGSSAGPAIQELVNREFMRTRGKLGEQGVQSQRQIAADQQKLSTYIADKKNNLEMWKVEAVKTIDQNFRSALSDIEGRKFDLERDKTAAKMQALQDAQTRAQSVRDNENNFKMGLAQMAVEQAQSVSNRAFTAQEIAAITQPIMASTIGSFTDMGAQQGGGTLAGSQQYNFNEQAPTDDYEELINVGQ